MKNKKIIIGISLICYFILGICLFSYASTKGTAYLTTDKSKVEKGEQIEVSVNLQNSKTAAFSTNLFFDDTKWEYVSGPENTNIVGNRIIYVWYDELGGKGAKEGELAKFQFKAKEDGSSSFVIEGEFYSAIGQEIQMEFKEAHVQIGEEKTVFSEQENQEQGTDTKSNNAKLQALRVDQEGIVPNFESDILEYYLIIPNTIQELEVLYVAENPNAVVEVTGNRKLKEGLNTIRVKVTSEDGSNSNTYTIQVTKTQNFELANTNLEILAIENVLLTPPFDNNVTQYKAEVSNETTNLNILAVPENEKAKVEIKKEEELKEGDNLVTINVVAENGFTKKQYEIIVHRRNSEEEEQHEKEEQENEEKLEEAFEIEQTSTGKGEEKKQEENGKNNGVVYIIVGIVIVGIIMGSVIWYKKRK